MERKELTKIVAACLFGDGSVHINRAAGHKNAMFRIAQTIDHRDHIEYIATYLGLLTNLTFWEKSKFGIGSGRNPKNQLWLETRTHPFYTNIYNRFYPNGHKVIDPHYLTLLDWEFLAIWYMQDGFLAGHTNQTYGTIKLSTHNFTYAENHLLRIALKDRLGLEWNVKSHRQNSKQYWFLSLRSTHNEIFLDGVRDYIQPSFGYKVPVMVGSRIIRDEDIV